MRSAIFWFVVILTVVLDQSTKRAIEVTLADGPKVIIPGILNLVHVENTGAAFSLGQGAGVIFVLVAVLFLVGSVYVIWKTPGIPLPLVVSLGLVSGGGLGNMADRIMTGSVTDFIATAFIDFPVFNVADICITVGVFSLFVGYLVWDSKRERVDQERSSVLCDDGIDSV